ncbi:hypothetical protein REPUB_Repub12eG0045000 [Reevesia pubescens]
MEVLKRVEEATEEVKTSKKTLEEALNRVEASNKGKLAVEEALRKWRSEHGRKRCSVHNSTKFKNSYPSHNRKDSRLLDVNGLNLVSDGPTPVLKPTLSIGQILSRKLLLPEDFETEMLAEKGTVKRKVTSNKQITETSKFLQELEEDFSLKHIDISLLIKDGASYQQLAARQRKGVCCYFLFSLKLFAS